MIKHRRERRRSAAVQHGEQRLYLTKRSSPGNIEQTVPSYSIRLFSLNLVHLELAYQFVQFLVTDLAPRSDTRASKVIYLQKEAWKKREREFSNEISIENRGERNSRRNRRDAPKRRGCGGGGASGLCST